MITERFEADHHEIQAIAAIGVALDAAKLKHPRFPAWKGDMASILGEEFGEVCTAVNDHLCHNGPKDEILKELTHVAAVAIRMYAAISAEEEG